MSWEAAGSILSLIFSAVAIAVSIIAFRITREQKTIEMRRSIRNQMSTLMIELTKSLVTKNGQEQDDGRVHRMVALSRQAVYLIEQEPSLITDVEYMTVADGLARVGDVETADAYWRKGFEVATSPFMKIVARRGYGYFLFSLGKVNEGRKQYEEALRLVDYSTDQNKALHIHTYLNCLSTEIQHGFVREAELHYESAKQLVRSIGSNQRRQAMQEAVDASRKENLPAHDLGQGPVTAPASQAHWISNSSES